MRFICYLCVFFITLIFSSAQSSGLSTVKRTLECRSVQLTAITVVDISLDIWGIGTYQKIALTHKSNGHVYSLDLIQHKSKSSEMKGKVAVDALADTWRCFQAKSGLEYVFIMFGCNHDDAKSCDVAMNSPTSGFDLIYDDTGHLLTKIPGATTLAEEADLKARGLLQESIQSTQEVGKDNFIYH